MSRINMWHSMQMMVQPTVHSYLKYLNKKQVNNEIYIEFVILALPLPEFIFPDKIFNPEQ